MARRDINSNVTRTLVISPIITAPSTVNSASVDVTAAAGRSINFDVIVGAMVATSTLDLKLQYALAATPTTWVDEPAVGSTLPTGTAYNTTSLPQIVAATGADTIYTLVVNAPTGKHYRVVGTVGTANVTFGAVASYQTQNIAA